MNKIYNVAIVGGGASGLLCATELLLGDNAFYGSDIVILEKNDRVGKKLVATGNGQGNLSNKNITLENYSGDKGFIKAYFPILKEIDIINYFEKLGIFTDTDEDGKIYPISYQANSILDNIRYFLQYKNCQIKTNFFVDNIERENDHFVITCSSEKILAKNVVCAFGGLAGKQYGTDGSSMCLLKNFGHKFTEFYPSLVQLKVDLGEFKGLKGIKQRAKVVSKDGDKILKESEGDLLFTEYGLSGSTIFMVSGSLQQAKNPIISIELLPRLSKNQLLNIIKVREKLDFIPREDLLLGIVNKQLGKLICKKYKTTNEIVDCLKNLTFKVSGNLGFNNAQVTKGGVCLAEVNPFSMQSKLQKDLYVAGELLDVDGDCGGYNLTFAFCTGITIARNIKEKFGR